MATGSFRCPTSEGRRVSQQFLTFYLCSAVTSIRLHPNRIPALQHHRRLSSVSNQKPICLLCLFLSVYEIAEADVFSSRRVSCSLSLFRFQLNLHISAASKIRTFCSLVSFPAFPPFSSSFSWKWLLLLNQSQTSAVCLSHCIRWWMVHTQFLKNLAVFS